MKKKRKRFRKLTRLDSSGDARLSSSTLTLTVNVSAMGEVKRLALTSMYIFQHRYGQLRDKDKYEKLERATPLRIVAENVFHSSSNKSTIAAMVLSVV